MHTKVNHSAPSYFWGCFLAYQQPLPLLDEKCDQRFQRANECFASGYILCTNQLPPKYILFVDLYISLCLRASWFLFTDHTSTRAKAVSEFRMDPRSMKRRSRVSINLPLKNAEGYVHNVSDVKFPPSGNRYFNFDVQESNKREEGCLLRYWPTGRVGR